MELSDKSRMNTQADRHHEENDKCYGTDSATCRWLVRFALLALHGSLIGSRAYQNDSKWHASIGLCLHPLHGDLSLSLIGTQALCYSLVRSFVLLHHSLVRFRAHGVIIMWELTVCFQAVLKHTKHFVVLCLSVSL